MKTVASISGIAVARDIKGKQDRVVTVISNETTMCGQVYEAMSNAGYLDSNMVVILNDSRHSLHPKLEKSPKTTINMLSSTLSKLQSSKSFRKFREAAKVCFSCVSLKKFWISCMNVNNMIKWEIQFAPKLNFRDGLQDCAIISSFCSLSLVYMFFAVLNSVILYLIQERYNEKEID